MIVREALKEDAVRIARLIVAAWPVEDFLRMGNDLTLDDLVSVITGYVEAEDTIYSYRNTLVAVEESVIVGVINGYDGAEYRDLKRPVTDDLHSRFGNVSFASSEETEAGEYYIDSVAVDASMRSRGIGSILIDSIVGRAVSEGHSTVGLIVDYDKPKAQALYERLGFSVVGEKDFMGHRMKHMQKKIG